MRRFAILSVVITTALAAPEAAAEDRVRLLLDGAFDVSTSSYGRTIILSEFLEEGSLDTRYEADPAAGWDAGVQIRLWRGLGLVASYARVDRDAGVTFTAELPHPLFFDRPRAAAGEASAPLEYSERAVHVGLAYAVGGGAFDFTVFGGPSFFDVRADLVESLDYTQAYPFDEVNVVGTTQASAKDSPIGFHVGARLDYRLAGHFGLGAQLRYSGVQVELGAGDDESSDAAFDAGGLQVAVGLRLYF